MNRLADFLVCFSAALVVLNVGGTTLFGQPFDVPSVLVAVVYIAVWLTVQTIGHRERGALRRGELFAIVMIDAAVWAALALAFWVAA